MYFINPSAPSYDSVQPSCRPAELPAAVTDARLTAASQATRSDATDGSTSEPDAGVAEAELAALLQVLNDPKAPTRRADVPPRRRRLGSRGQGLPGPVPR